MDVPLPKYWGHIPLSHRDRRPCLDLINTVRIVSTPMVVGQGLYRQKQKPIQLHSSWLDDNSTAGSTWPTGWLTAHRKVAVRWPWEGGQADCSPSVRNISLTTHGTESSPMSIRQRPHDACLYNKLKSAIYSRTPTSALSGWLTLPAANDTSSDFELCLPRYEKKNKMYVNRDANIAQHENRAVKPWLMIVARDFWHCTNSFWLID